MRPSNSRIAFSAYSEGLGSLPLAVAMVATKPVTSRNRVNPANPYLRYLKVERMMIRFKKDRQTQPLPAGSAAATLSQAVSSLLEP